MKKLIAELQRLFFLPGQPGDGASLTLADGRIPVALDLVSDEGMARVMVVDFCRAADWPKVAELCLALQTDLDLPAPAVSVSGSQGFSLWLSLVEPVPVAQLEVFLQLLRLRYLAEIPLDRLNLLPNPAAATIGIAATINLPPGLNKTNGMWSAFIDPAHGANFTDEPWLEMAPPMDKQAARLAEVESIKAAAFVKALSIMQPLSMPAAGLPETKLPTPGKSSDKPRGESRGESASIVLPIIPAIKLSETRLGMFLTSEELEFLTGYKLTSHQCRWLKFNAWVFVVAAGGRPVVSRAYAEQKMGVKSFAG